MSLLLLLFLAPLLLYFNSYAGLTADPSLGSTVAFTAGHAAVPAPSLTVVSDDSAAALVYSASSAPALSALLLLQLPALLLLILLLHCYLTAYCNHIAWSCL